MFRDSPHPDPASCGNQSVEFRHKIQITGFPKTRDSRAGNLKTNLSNKSQ